MNRRGKRRADPFEKLYKNIRKNVKTYSKKETMDLIKLKYSEMWTAKKSLKDREMEIAETPADAGKEVYYIAADNN
ncbi:hypothetical protein NEMIN01_1642 [Nematocida minor]|uniref:uncharacterized protein n=1 Tax=Nematocida minor TaxID=1912983 RepID=UPI00222122C1|nr:uncharacterized protein NEMIN01_1642 [Nematocida minor]KAI5191751.1 hypothetical protein NEMIN01_1642 [Nematocida minor]